MAWQLTQSLGLVAYQRYCVDEGFEEQRMLGYFGIGIERLRKPINAGILFRSAQAFGAGFLFTVKGSYFKKRRIRIPHNLFTIYHFLNITPSTK